MILLDIPQRGEEWVKARMGIPTASNFDRILTPKTRRPSTSAPRYIHELLAEWLTGAPEDSGAGIYADRGAEIESWAVDWYELQRGLSTKKIGLVLRDDRMVAASPDRLVEEEGLLEIKCPSASVHVANLLHGQETHYCQVQGQLWLSERKWCDLLSFHPEITPALVRIERDEEFIALLDGAVSAFVRVLLQERQRLLDLGCTPAERVRVPIQNLDPEPF